MSLSIRSEGSGDLRERIVEEWGGIEIERSDWREGRGATCARGKEAEETIVSCRFEPDCDKKGKNSSEENLVENSRN